MRRVADEDAVLVVAKIVVEIAAAQEKLLADEQAFDFFFGDFAWLGGVNGLRSVGRGAR